jgi:hypothetical protein
MMNLDSTFAQSLEVLTCRGDKNAYEIDRGVVKASMPDMPAFCASKTMCLPMLIYPHKKYHHKEKFPDDWGVGHSSTGWM